jgi:hypothetical protein
LVDNIRRKLSSVNASCIQKGILRMLVEYLPGGHAEGAPVVRRARPPFVNRIEPPSAEAERIIVAKFNKD